MKIESVRLKSFKSFKNVELRDIPRFCVLIGANGTGKSTLFGLFGFLKAALSGNVHTALARLGGSRGFREVCSRGAKGNIEIELQFQEHHGVQLVAYAYELSISERGGFSVVEREVLKYRRGSNHRQPWYFLLDFSCRKGYTITNEPDAATDVTQLDRQEQRLKSPDILAIKGLAQFERFPAVVALGNLIENWRISDFHINRARPEQEAGYAEHLSTEGENLALVTEFLTLGIRTSSC